MALSMIPIPPDAARDKKARELAKTAHTWNVVTLKQDWGAFKKGDQALQTPNGYRVNAVWCECPDYATWGNICKHIRTVAILDQRNLERERANRVVPGAVHQPQTARSWRRCQRCPALIDPAMGGRHCDSCAAERLAMLQGAED